MSTLALAAGIGALGGLGALARFAVDRAVSSRSSTRLPLGTFVVNVSGTLLLGIVVGAGGSGGLLVLLATGLIGSYTTFSAWAFESRRLGEGGELGLALVNFAAGLAAGIGVLWLGMRIGGLL